MNKKEIVDLMVNTWKDYTRNMSPERSGVRLGMELVLNELTKRDLVVGRAPTIKDGKTVRQKQAKEAFDIFFEKNKYRSY